MEELNEKLERTKCYVNELLIEVGFQHLFDENYIEKKFEEQFYRFGNTYKLAINIYDLLIISQD